ncbi:hypothetical protein PR048_017049 [Dryococelus australis]|uniref:Uncharacterized protein n=1 Tax=Dryococelus australis TaxID=614101 RepID=A0ABQ9H8F0_9NEOP|nr:hypothetical protein PR048_017049 [Dryococelus australis]
MTEENPRRRSRTAGVVVQPSKEEGILLEATEILGRPVRDLEVDKSTDRRCTNILIINDMSSPGLQTGRFHLRRLSDPARRIKKHAGAKNNRPRARQCTNICFRPRSAPIAPYLTPCDFYLWGYIRCSVYAPLLPRNIADLIERIVAAAAAIDRPMWMRLFLTWASVGLLIVHVPRAFKRIVNTSRALVSLPGWPHSCESEADCSASVATPAAHPVGESRDSCLVSGVPSHHGGNQKPLANERTQLPLLPTFTSPPQDTRIYRLRESSLEEAPKGLRCEDHCQNRPHRRRRTILCRRQLQFFRRSISRSALVVYQIIAASWVTEPASPPRYLGPLFTASRCCLCLAKCYSDAARRSLANLFYFMDRVGGKLSFAAAAAAASATEDPMRAKRGTKRRRNERAEETEDLRENPPTSGIIQPDSHMRKTASDPTIRVQYSIGSCFTSNLNFHGYAQRDESIACQFRALLLVAMAHLAHVAEPSLLLPRFSFSNVGKILQADGRLKPAKFVLLFALDFRMWESYRTMTLVGGFSRISPVSPDLAFRCWSILT